MQDRLKSLDVLRGATIAGMILVNNPGDWSKTFAPLLHAKWHGWTPTDLIFPFFLVVMGAAIPLALTSRIERSSGRLGPIYRQIVRRTVILFALGLVLAWFPFVNVDWQSARVLGVLQRIAVVYLLASFSFLHLGKAGRVWLCSALLLGYWAVMELVPVPGFGAGDLGPEGNLAAWVDHQILGQHVWRNAPGPGDPEGILSTFPAVATALAGIFAGEWLRSKESASDKVIGLFVWGYVLAAGGSLFSYFFPVNKNLWTSSYVVLTAGLALLTLAVIYYLVDIRGWTRWTGGFVVFGTNPITVFVLSSLVTRMLYLIRWTGDDGSRITLKAWLYGACFASWMTEYYASLAWALLTVAVWWILMKLLYDNKIMIKI